MSDLIFNEERRVVDFIPHSRLRGSTLREKKTQMKMCVLQIYVPPSCSEKFIRSTVLIPILRSSGWMKIELDKIYFAVSSLNIHHKFFGFNLEEQSRKR